MAGGIIRSVVTAEIIAVGNELLLGIVQDTNSSYLCRVVRGFGGRVSHVALVGDLAGEIAGEIQRSLERQPAVIFTCGGLGPTEDDVTLEGVALAAGRALVLDRAAREFVSGRYSELARSGHVASAEMTAARLKMAQIPDGGEIVQNPAGTAPAITLRIGATWIVALPGVPAELRAIVEGPLGPFLSEVFGGGGYHERELVVACGDESVLAPILSDVSGRHRDVYIKSRASGFGPDITFRVLLSASGSNLEEAKRRLTSAADDLLASLAATGIATK